MFLLYWQLVTSLTLSTQHLFHSKRTFLIPITSDLLICTHVAILDSRVWLHFDELAPPFVVSVCVGERDREG